MPEDVNSALVGKILRKRRLWNKVYDAAPAAAAGAARSARLEIMGSVSRRQISGGVVHDLPADLREALVAETKVLEAWEDITPLARNEFICWVEDAKQEKTRERRIRRTREELEEGQRRPCCWPGCKHRERTGAP